jgi:Leucine-rich repeat (LRR) protein
MSHNFTELDNKNYRSSVDWIKLIQVYVEAIFSVISEIFYFIPPIYLQVLDLSYTELKDLPENLLHTPKYLKVLNLTGNLMTRVPSALEHSHALEVLHFCENPVVVLDRSRYVMAPDMVFFAFLNFCSLCRTKM